MDRDERRNSKLYCNRCRCKDQFSHHNEFDSAIVLNQPSLDKFEKAVKPGGLLLYEQSTIIHPPTREDIDVVCIPAIEEADKLKAKQVC